MRGLPQKKKKKKKMQSRHLESDEEKNGLGRIE